MRAFNTKRSNSGLRGRGALIAALAVVGLGTVGFAAAGGVEMITEWFVTVEIEIDGEIIEIDDAEVEIELEGNTATVTVDASDLGIDVPPGTPITVTATASGGDGGAQSAVESAEIKTITIDATTDDSDDE